LDVACLLMHWLADIRDGHGIRVALIIQYPALDVTGAIRRMGAHSRPCSCVR
jgi:hypothetical protein